MIEPTVSLAAFTGLHGEDRTQSFTLGFNIFPKARGVWRFVGLHAEQMSLGAKRLDEPEKTKGFAIGVVGSAGGAFFVSVNVIVHPEVHNRGHISVGVSPETFGKIKSIFDGGVGKGADGNSAKKE